MNRHVYNASLGLGWALTSTGVGLWSPAGGLVTAGVLLMAFTVAGALLSARSAR